MIKNKRLICILLYITISFSLFSAAKRPDQARPLRFEETWGFVAMNRAEEYRDDLPLTDVCYFAADVNCYGELIDVPDIDKITVTGKYV